MMHIIFLNVFCYISWIYYILYVMMFCLAYTAAKMGVCVICDFKSVTSNSVV